MHRENGWRFLTRRLLELPLELLHVQLLHPRPVHGVLRVGCKSLRLLRLLKEVLIDVLQLVLVLWDL